MQYCLETLYKKIDEYIKKVNFETLWVGFKRLKFALYDDEKCFFNGKYISKTNDFIANTAIFYQGEPIAIWCVKEEIDPVILASKIVHEMFHGFQKANGEKRFFDELDALYNYKYTHEHLSVKLQENQRICELISTFSKEKFDELLRMRKYRYTHFLYEYRYEASIEQIEGTANYVELQSLKQLSPDLYAHKIRSMIQNVCNANNFFPIRIVCYDVGALLLCVLKENGLPYDTGFTDITFAESLLSTIPEENLVVEQTIGDGIEKYYAAAGRTIASAIAKNDVVWEGLSDILGVNVYNAVYYQNYIISRYFVMYADKGETRVEYGDFVIETNEYKKCNKIYKL